MKFLIDNALSPELKKLLEDENLDVEHVRDVGLSSADDEEIFNFAEKEDRIIISADTDFGYILKTRRSKKPSYILLRKGSALAPKKILREILYVIKFCENDLENGSIIVIQDEKLRIRKLPILE